MKRAKFLQIGNTCGFYSLVYCIDSLIHLNQPEIYSQGIINKAKEDGLSYIGEVFDINQLAQTAEQYFSDFITADAVPIKKESDILTLLCDSRLIFPVSLKGTPHYISLTGLSGGKIKCCSGGRLYLSSAKKLFISNRRISQHYNWRRFKTCSRFDLFVTKYLMKLSQVEYELCLDDLTETGQLKRELHKLGKVPVNMRGYCIRIKRKR